MAQNSATMGGQQQPAPHWLPGQGRMPCVSQAMWPDTSRLKLLSTPSCTAPYADVCHCVVQHGSAADCKIDPLKGVLQLQQHPQAYPPAAREDVEGHEAELSALQVQLEVVEEQCELVLNDARRACSSKAASKQTQATAVLQQT